MAVTAFWGSTFLIIQLAMQHSGPLFFVGLRFVTAGLVGTLVFWKRLQGLTRQDLVAGMVIGISICLGYVLQTWGLKTIPVSQSAFITGLYVPMVPLLQWLVMRRRPSVMNLVGVTLAFAGLVLMAGPQEGEFGMTFGAWVTLAGAVAIAFEIILIGHYAGRVDLGRVTVVQLYAAGSGLIGAGLFLGVARGGHRAGPQQHPHPVGHELGPENGLADPGHGHLRR